MNQKHFNLVYIKTLKPDFIDWFIALIFFIHGFDFDELSHYSISCFRYMGPAITCILQLTDSSIFLTGFARNYVSWIRLNVFPSQKPPTNWMFDGSYRHHERDQRNEALPHDQVSTASKEPWYQWVFCCCCFFGVFFFLCFIDIYVKYLTFPYSSYIYIPMVLCKDSLESK
jgi:hypothetical protein